MSFERSASPLAIMQSSNVPLESQALCLSKTLAHKLAYAIPLPPAAQARPQDFFDAQLRDYVTNEICKVNEQLVLDIESTMIMVRTIWNFRYKLAFVPNMSDMVKFLEILDNDPQCAEQMAYKIDPVLYNSLAHTLQLGVYGTPAPGAKIASDYIAAGPAA